MQFVCLGYMEEKNWDAMSPDQQQAMIDECFAYDEELLKSGHWLKGGQALQSVQTAKTVSWKGGKAIVTDGPFAETKEQLGGLGLLEAEDMNQAVELMSKHPGIRHGGPFEIRPMDDQARKRELEASAAPRSVAAAPDAQAAVKFACMGYLDESIWAGVSSHEMDAMLKECIAFDEARRQAGQWVSGIGLQSARTAKTVRYQGGKVVVIDGPYAETKEHLGGIAVQQFRDMSDAIELLSTHPCLPAGVSIEIRPIDKEINARWEARRQRHATSA
jgi:hypothetical protein